MNGSGSIDSKELKVAEPSSTKSFRKGRTHKILNRDPMDKIRKAYEDFVEETNASYQVRTGIRPNLSKVMIWNLNWACGWGFRLPRRRAARIVAGCLGWARG